MYHLLIKQHQAKKLFNKRRIKYCVKSNYHKQINDIRMKSSNVQASKQVPNEWTVLCTRSFTVVSEGERKGQSYPASSRRKAVRRQPSLVRSVLPARRSARRRSLEPSHAPLASPSPQAGLCSPHAVAQQQWREVMVIDWIAVVGDGRLDHSCGGCV